MSTSFRLAIRSLSATPVVAVLAVLSLALAIGANAALFSIFDALVLRNLPVGHPDRLVSVSGGIPNYPFVAQLPGYTDAIWNAVSNQAGTFQDAAAWAPSRFDLATGGETDFADGLFVSGSFFRTLEVAPLFGRGIEPSDDPRRAGGAKVVVVSYDFWQRRLGANPEVIGTALRIEHVPFAIVGVMPEAFYGPEVGRRFDLVMPIATAPLLGRAPLLRAWVFRILIRLRPDQSIDAAQSALRVLQSRIRAAAAPEAPASLDVLKNPLSLTHSATGTSALRAQYERPVMVLLALLIAILLLACVNIVTALLARASVRRGQVGVQLALGASWWDIVAPHLAESVMLSALGTAVGAGFATVATRLVVSELSSQTMQVRLDLSPDWRVMAFTAGLASVVCLLFGTIPAHRYRGVKPADALQRNRGTEHGNGRWPEHLVVMQVGTSLVLVVGCALFLRSLVRLETTPTGFDAAHVLLVNVNTSRAGSPTQEERLGIFRRMMTGLAALPGVSAVGASTLTAAGGISVVTFLGTPENPARMDAAHAAATNVVTPGWFAASGLTVREGRDFNGQDGSGKALVAIVNEAFAAKWLVPEHGVGATVRDIDGNTRRVIGVTSDSIYNSIKEPKGPTLYVPLAEAPAALTVSVRAATGAPSALRPAVSRLIRETNPDYSFSFRDLSDQLDASIAQERVLGTISAAFGFLALILAGVGIYGTTTVMVSDRRREVAIRLAVGAAPIAAVAPMLRRLLTLMIVALTVGLILSSWLSRFLATLLYGIRPHDALAYGGATILVIGMAAIAAIVPAVRASRLDPARVLGES